MDSPTLSSVGFAPVRYADDDDAGSLHAIDDAVVSDTQSIVARSDPSEELDASARSRIGCLLQNGGGA